MTDWIKVEEFARRNALFGHDGDGFKRTQHCLVAGPKFGWGTGEILLWDDGTISASVSGWIGAVEVTHAAVVSLPS